MPNSIHAAESWKPVVGFEGSYEISDLGNVRSLLTDRILRQSRVGRYLGVHLRRAGRTHTRYTHHLVAEAFIGPRPDGLDTCHDNGDRHDNRAVNLRYDTRHANMRDSLEHGTHQSISITHCPKGHELTPENTYRREYKSADGGTKYRDRCRTCQGVKSKHDYAIWKARQASQ